MHTDVVIIGGGLAGLTCAIGLIGSGYAVTLVEAGPSLGGRARSWVDAQTGDTIDIGPHIFVSEYRNMLALLDHLGTRDQIAWHTDKLITLVDGARAVVMRSRPLPPPFHLLPSLLTADPISWWDVMANFRVTAFAMRIDEEDILRLDAQRADEFLREMGVPPRFIDWFWRTTSMTIMNVPLERCSAGALLRFYRHLVGHRRLCMGFASVGLGELYASQAMRLITSAGGQVMLNASARALLHEQGRVAGIALADGRRIAARYCVAAVPPRELRALLPAAWADHDVFAGLADFHPVPYVSSYLWFDRKLTREQFWAQPWSPTTLNYDFYDLSNVRTGWATRPSVIASNLIQSERVAGLDDQAIVRATLEELRHFLPAAHDTAVRHTVVNRIPMAICEPRPGLERKRPPTETPFRGLVLAGDWIRTGLPSSMESAVRSGWLAAERLWAERGERRSLAQTVGETEGISGIARWLSQRTERHATVNRPGHTR